MKTLIFLLALCLLTITSCQTTNFNKRKFTDLKPIHGKYEENDKLVQEECMLAFDDKVEETSVNFKEDLDRLTENDPRIISIQNAIKEGIKIVIKSGDDYYEMKQPFYDGLSRNLIGSLVKKDEQTAEEHIEITVSDYRKSPNGLVEISVNDISSVENKQELIQHQEPGLIVQTEEAPTLEDVEKVEKCDTIVMNSGSRFVCKILAQDAEIITFSMCSDPEKEYQVAMGDVQEILGSEEEVKDIKVEKPEIKQTPLKQEEIQEMSIEDYKKSVPGRKAKMSFLIGLPFVGIAVISFLLAAAFFSLIFLPVFIISFVVAFTLMCISLRNSKILKDELKTKNQKMNKKAERIRKAARVFAIIGIVILSVGLVAGILLLIGFF